MRWASLAVVAIGSFSQFGCGGSAPPSAMHSKSGEELTSFPNDRGSFEIRYETPSTRTTRGKGHVATIVVSFYQADGTTPMSPPPTAVKVRFGTEAGSPTVDLSPSTGTAQAPNRFASKPGEYPESLRGVLTATVNGESVEAPFSAR